METKLETTYEEKIEALSEFNEGAVLLDGLEEALIGVCTRFGIEPVAAYDRDKCIEILRRSMTWEEAEEYFEYNVIGGWFGDYTPIFVTRI